MHARTGLTDLDRAHDVRMLDPFAVTRFAEEPSNCSPILAELLAQDLYGDRSMIRVLGAENGRSPAFTDLALERISGNCLSNKVFAWHAANLIARRECGKQM